MEATSGIHFAIEAGIKSKLNAVGAISREKAVTCHQANFTMQEINWIDYIAGGMFARVKKTGTGRFYV